MIASVCLKTRLWTPSRWTTISNHEIVPNIYKGGEGDSVERQLIVESQVFKYWSVGFEFLTECWPNVLVFDDPEWDSTIIFLQRCLPTFKSVLHTWSVQVRKCDNLLLMLVLRNHKQNVSGFNNDDQIKRTFKEAALGSLRRFLMKQQINNLRK